MYENLIKNADELYRLEEKKAKDYFKLLYKEVIDKSYITILTKDIELWKVDHISKASLVTRFFHRKVKPKTSNYSEYIKWLEYTGNLDNYLERSVSYIFMRDLGKTLNSSDTQRRITNAVNNIKNSLTNSKKTDQSNFSIVSLYKNAEKEEIESTFIWLVEKLKKVSMKIPKEMDAEHAQRKLIKIIAGVVMHQIEEMDDDLPKLERKRRLDEAIRLGYSYGLTYPFIDDLLDAKVLSFDEEKKYSNLIRTSLITGVVPEMGNWNGENKKLIEYIHLELKEAFEYIKNHQSEKTRESFFKKAYVFFNSQEIDRKKELSNEGYTNEEIYIPIILKSASSRLITRSVISPLEDAEFNSRTFYYGIYNQLADDFADMFDDFKLGAVTPYTYYMKHYKKRRDLINPFELYWIVIYNLIHNVYDSDEKACRVILQRAINGLKRFKDKLGREEYNKVMDIFEVESKELTNTINYMVKKGENVDFLDKLLRDNMTSFLREQRRSKEEFKDTVKSLREEINSILTISKNEKFTLYDNILDAANYSLKGDGKRIRPIMTYVLGRDGYNLEKSTLIPLAKSIEYMHTASLIFDDLPSQDNASTRRGRLTLHKVYNTAVAELTGLYLTQKAVEEQSSIKGVDSKNLLSLINYSAKITSDMCKGQILDLNSKGKKLTLEELNIMCFYKTGKAFEASLIMPAILGGAPKSEIEALKRFSYYAGIAFQIKDDILDVEGEEKILGKQIGKDAENNNSTFVSTLGLCGAKKEMWKNYSMAIKFLKDVPRNTTFLKHLLDYIINRNR